MDRRGFLRLLGGAVVAAAAPTKAYSFLGGILRPRPQYEFEWSPLKVYEMDTLDWRFAVRITNIDISTLVAAANQSGKGQLLEGLLERLTNPGLILKR